MQRLRLIETGYSAASLPHISFKSQTLPGFVRRSIGALARRRKFQSLISDDTHVKKPWAFLFKLFFGLLLAIASISLAASFFTSQSFIPMFQTLLFWGGLLLVVVSGLVGAGFSEVREYTSRERFVSATFQKAMRQDRLQRRSEQFAFMIVGVAMGLALMGLPALLNLFSS